MPVMFNFMASHGMQKSVLLVFVLLRQNYESYRLITLEYMESSHWNILYNFTKSY